MSDPIADAVKRCLTLAPQAHADDVQIRWTDGAGPVARIPPRSDPTRTDVFLDLHFGRVADPPSPLHAAPHKVETHGCFVGAELVYVVCGKIIEWRYDAAKRAGLNLRDDEEAP